MLNNKFFTVFLLILNYSTLIHKGKNITFLFLSIIPIIILFSINNIDDAHGQNNGTTTQTLVQQNPGSIELQPPIDAQTGQTIKLPGTVVGIKDPVTGEILTREVKLQPAKVTGSSLSSTTPSSNNNNNNNNNDNLELLSNVLPTYPVGGSSATLEQPTLADNNTKGFSLTKPEITTSSDAPSPTYNPPLKKCDTTTTGTEGGFDLAKYIVKGKFDKNKIKGDDFKFQIFADLVANDETEINGKDAPYKASISTNNYGESPVDLAEITTVCIDTQQIINLNENADEINVVNKPDSFQSLDY
jgi:hypothetical protein